MDVERKEPKRDPIGRHRIVKEGDADGQVHCIVC